MHALIVSKHFPKDLRTNVGGTFQRLRLFIDALKKESAKLDALFYVPPQVDTSPAAVAVWEQTLAKHWDIDLHLTLCPEFEGGDGRSKWREYASAAVSFFQQPEYAATSGSRQVEAFEACLQRNPGLIFAHKLGSMCPLMLSKRPLPPVFFDLDDIEHIVRLRMIRQKQPLRAKLFHATRLPALWWGERRAIRLAAKTFVCSETDRDYLRTRWRLPGVDTVPNALREAKPFPVSSARTLLFIGSFLYQPNMDAANFLINDVWPYVLKAIPDARLIIAGAPHESLSNRSTPGVEFTGFVADLEALYQRSRVVCVPILTGGGTRVKIIEAAGYAKPIVATSIGAEGLRLRDGHDLLLRDEPIAFAQACVDLLRDSSLCERLGKRAYQAAISHHDRAGILQLIQRHIKDIAVRSGEPLRTRLDQAVS
jgi:glycosyltransferase involved in cell wall biosynthesis